MRVSKETIKVVQDELKLRGYSSEYKEVEKNKVTLDGLCVWKGEERPNIIPTIYLGELFREGEGDEAVMEEVINFIIKTVDDEVPDIDMDKLFNKDAIFESVKIGVQQEGSREEILSRPTEFEGIIQYLYYEPQREMTIKVRQEHLECLKIDEDEPWERALKNTEENTKIIDLWGMTIVTNDDKIKGAGAIVSKNVIQKAKRELHSETMVIIPSSVHEVIVMPYTDEVDMEYIDALVRKVNEEEVRPEEVLSDRAYVA